mgnify:CR=1 FL=1
MVRTLPKEATAEDMASLLEDIELQLQEKMAYENKKEVLEQLEITR